MVKSSLRRRWWVLALALAIGGLVGVGHFAAVSLRGGLQDEDAGANQLIFRPVACKGFVDLEEPIRQLNPSVPGIVAAVLVRADDHVPASAPLLRMDDKLARDNVDKAKVALEIAQSQLENARISPEQHRIALDLAQK